MTENFLSWKYKARFGISQRFLCMLKAHASFRNILIMTWILSDELSPVRGGFGRMFNQSCLNLLAWNARTMAFGSFAFQGGGAWLTIAGEGVAYDLLSIHVDVASDKYFKFRVFHVQCLPLNMTCLLMKSLQICDWFSDEYDWLISQTFNLIC